MKNLESMMATLREQKLRRDQTIDHLVDVIVNDRDPYLRAQAARQLASILDPKTSVDPNLKFQCPVCMRILPHEEAQAVDREIQNLPTERLEQVADNMTRLNWVERTRDPRLANHLCFGCLTKALGMK